VESPCWCSRATAKALSWAQQVAGARTKLAKYSLDVDKSFGVFTFILSQRAWLLYSVPRYILEKWLDRRLPTKRSECVVNLQIIDCRLDAWQVLRNEMYENGPLQRPPRGPVSMRLELLIRCSMQE
jgi:hypothetical protein